MGNAMLTFDIHVVPAAVRNLSAALVTGDSHIRLTWEPVSGTSGYDIERCLNSCLDGSFVPDISFGHGGIDTIQGPESVYIDENVTVGSTYTYRVAAFVELETPEGSVALGHWSERVTAFVGIPPTPTATAAFTPTPAPTLTPTATATLTPTLTAIPTLTPVPTSTWHPNSNLHASTYIYTNAHQNSYPFSN